METTFTVSPSYTNILKGGGTKNITVTSLDYNWSASTDANWIQLSQNIGTTGETTVVLTTEENPFYKRTGIVEFFNTNGESSSVTVTQNGNFNGEPIIPLIRVGVTGNSYVNINYTFSGDETIKIEGASFSKYADSGSTLFSYGLKNGASRLAICSSGTSLGARFYGGVLREFSGSYKSFIANSTIEITKQSIKINDTQVCAYGSQLSEGDYRMTLFANDSRGTNAAGGGWDLISLGTITIYDGSNNVKARFVPVMLNENYYSINYYEEITKTLYSGSGYIRPIDAYFNQYNKINVGGNQSENLYIGQTEVQTAYIGSSLAKLPKREISYITSGIGTTSPTADATKNFFDTGICPKTSTKFKINGIWRGVNNGECIVGSRYVVSTDAYRFFNTGGKSYFDFNNSRIIMNGQTATSGNSFSYECGNNYLQNLNTTLKNTGTTQTSVSEDRTIKIYYDSIFFKQLQIWEGDTLVFDAQPITIPYKNSIARKVIYDSVSNRVIFNYIYNKS